MKKRFPQWLAASALACGAVVAAIAQDKKLPPPIPVKPSTIEDKVTSRTPGVEIVGPQMKAKHVLEKPVTLHVKNIQIQEVLRAFQKQIDVPIVVDPTPFKALGIDFSETLDIDVKDATLESAVSAIFGKTAVHFDIRSTGEIILTTRKPGDEVVTKVYPVADLLADLPPGFVNAAGKPTVWFIPALLAACGRESWEDKGGEGRVNFYAPNKTLVVRQSEHNHRRLQVAVTKLRSLTIPAPIGKAN